MEACLSVATSRAVVATAGFEGVLRCMPLNKAAACKADKKHQDGILEMPAELLQSV